MTFCEKLASGKAGKYDISAWKLTDKDSRAARYEISISADGIELYSVKTAKTTWKKRFAEMAK